MQIRKAKISDARNISILRRYSIKILNSKDYSKEALDFLLKKNNLKNTISHIKNEDLFCLVHNKRLLGTIALDKNKVSGLYIHPKFSGKGSGKMLVEFIEKYAKSKGIKKLKLYSTLTAYKFYLKLGYKLKEYGKWKIDSLDVKVPVIEKSI